MLKVLQLVAILLTAVAMSAGWAHMLEMANKMSLSRQDYLTVQQIYRGWALLGFVIIGALVCTAALAVMQYGTGWPFYLTLGAGLAIALILVVFFTFTYPANQATENWTHLPVEWESLRWQWEYSHAVGALLYFGALFALTLSILVDSRR